jgi:excisionase family DNA binding protein
LRQWLAYALQPMTLAEAADVLALSPDTLRSQIRYGRFKARKVGRDWHTTPMEVERYRRDVLGRAGRRKAT